MENSETQSYLRLYKRKGLIIAGKAVNAIDIGTKNMFVLRLVKCEATGKRYVTDACVVDLRDADGKQTIDVIANNIVPRLMDPALDWLWHTPLGQVNRWKHYVTVERQQDQLHTHTTSIMEQDIAEPEDKKKGGGGGGPNKYKKKVDYKPPVMFAIYGMLRMIVTALNKPSVFIQLNKLFTMNKAGVDWKNLGDDTVVFVPRDGKQKAGLKDKHGVARKAGEALEVAMEFMEEEGDYECMDWFETLTRPKPLQDANDAYLQARRFMDDMEEEEAKDGRRQDREEKRQQKKAPKPVPTKRATKRPREEVREDSESTTEPLTILAPASTKPRK